MCKLAYVSNLSKLTLKEKEKLFNDTQKGITEFERNGFGIASKSVSGKIETYRSLDVARSPFMTTVPPEFCQPISDGKINFQDANEVIFHGRTSTNTVSIPNTHPYNIGNTVLCHNGVLSYSGEDYDKKTDNDTEDLTYHFDKYGMKNLENVFTGYAAWIAFKKVDTHIVRDDRATLYYAYSKKNDCHVVATTMTLVRTMLKAMKSEKSDILLIKENYGFTIRNNKITKHFTWEGLKSSHYSDRYASSSLSYLGQGGTKYNAEETEDLGTVIDASSSRSKPTMLADGNTFEHEYGSYKESDFMDIEDVVLWELENGVADVFLDGDKLTAREYEKLSMNEKMKCHYKSKVS